MEKKSILIIGAGIAGLSAGCYGQMNGYRTQIFEMHDLPGGVCTSWQRQGYTVDGCLAWLVGSSPGTGYYRLWQDLGAVQGRTFVDHEEFLRVQGAEGKTLVLHCDLDRLEAHLKALAPQDADLIQDMISAARTCARYDPPLDKAPELMGALDGLKFLLKSVPFLRVVSRWKGLSLDELAGRFQDPFLRQALGLIADLPDHPALAFLMTLGWLDRGTAGYPLGGSLSLSRAIERRYFELGGEVHYGARVAEILVEENRAVGLRLEDGTTHRGDTIISAADGHTTLFELLGGEYLDDEIRGYYGELPVFPPLVHVALGVARSFEGLPHSVIYPLDPPLLIAGQERERLAVEIYNFDPSLAPPGKTVVKTMFHSDYAYWRVLREDATLYREEKAQVADQVIALLDERYPGLEAQVEMRDVATPLTWERYTGNWRGSYEGWLSTEETMPPFRLPKTLPGLDRFTMAGQWVEPGGGVPAVAMSGRNAIQILCKEDGRAFRDSTGG